MKNKFFVGYLVVMLGELIAVTFHYQWMEWVFKPLIMPAIMIFYFMSVKLSDEQFSKQVVVAMFFSWVGDIALMSLSISSQFFIVGLGSFLVAHIFYIFAYRFHKDEPGNNVLMGIQKFRYAFPIVLAGTGLIVVLYSHLGDLRIPVIIYAIVLIAMVLEAMFRYGCTKSASFWMVFAGALLFFISDSMIAIQKFLGGFSFDRVLIMATYMVAQFLIAKGLISHAINEKETAH